MSHLFPADRSLLFPQFETYRLRSLDPDTDLSFHPLPGGGATQSRVGYGGQNGSSHLSFKEVRARIGWDHLAVNYGSGRGVYVDTDWKVVGFELNVNLTPTFTVLAELPVPISSTEQQAEFPSVLAISSTHWAVSTGSGTVYILQTTPARQSFAGKVIARYDLPASTSPSDSSSSSSSDLSPFLLRSSHSVSDSRVRLLATRSIIPQGGKSKISTAQNTRFELLEFTIDLARSNGVDEGVPEKLQINWVLEGGDLPVWMSWNEGSWLVLSAEEFRTRTEEVKKEETEEERKKREREEKVSKLGLGASLPPTEGESNTDAPEIKQGDVDMDSEDQEYPYSWTQNAESIIVNIPVPAGVSRQEIHITLKSSSFTFALPSDVSVSEGSVLASFLSIPSRSWWTTIDPSASTWTYDSSKSLIELDLAKVDDNVRWPSVFSPTDDDGFDEVPETLSAATLAAVRDTFSQIKTRGPDEPEGMHPAMPALLREEMDFDLDDGEDYGDGQDGAYSELGGSGKVGRDVFIGSIAPEDGAAEWSKTNTSVISLPINGSSRHTDSVIIKNAVDGLTFEPAQRPYVDPWKHIATNPALAFVISSKRDLRLVRHLTSSTTPTSTSASASEVHPHQGAEPTSPSASKRTKPNIDTDANARTTVLAFDSGSSSAGSGNLYVYYPAESSTGAKQGVIPISGGERGALLGVGLVRAGEGEKEVVVALCEKELVVLKGIL
ncbi:hypothetical protein I317_05860 [Kwoniella heveanensis CBS 569]|uniref:NudC domain-containing protein 1 n=1 Tax=Kwoniella heveanensis BCC8398 TaxID=1296120 RepID=A0A1B9H0X7_9TREE|nr:hypothetical protein I316_01523 [Kwoniella heveanensis BCC8398]OCF40358.1 hypothetical protein I317_05860 [Kwoniella heveanensis CBS 569]